MTLSPDSIITPWLEAVQPKRLWVIGTSSPTVVGDYKAHAANEVAVLNPAEICSSHEMPEAATSPRVGNLALRGGAALRGQWMHFVCA